MIDFLKTTTLVPQIGKGIYQGINNKGAGQNVLGQLANNLGKNGFNIVAYAHGVDEKLKDLIYENLGANGSLNLDEFTMSEISGLLKPLLAEFGKDFYSIQFVRAEDIIAGMSINDKEGVVYINTYGDGFGHSSQMLEQLGHEGMHGTYASHLIDEMASSMPIKDPSKGWSQSIGANIGINAQGIIAASTNQYYIDRANGDLRDHPLIGGVAGAFAGIGLTMYKSHKMALGGHKFTAGEANSMLLSNMASGATKGAMIGSGNPILIGWACYDTYVEVTGKDLVSDEIRPFAEDMSMFFLKGHNEKFINMIEASCNAYLRYKTAVAYDKLKISNKQVISNNANNSSLHSKYKESLLKDDILENSNPIIYGKDLKDTKLIAELTKDGSSITDWAKMSAKKVNTKLGVGEVHYYQNLKTGKYSSYDIKLKVNANSLPKGTIKLQNITVDKTNHWIIDMDENFIPKEIRNIKGSKK